MLLDFTPFLLFIFSFGFMYLYCEDCWGFKVNIIFFMKIGYGVGVLKTNWDIWIIECSLK